MTYVIRPNDRTLQLVLLCKNSNVAKINFKQDNFTRKTPDKLGEMHLSLTAQSAPLWFSTTLYSFCNCYFFLSVFF